MMFGWESLAASLASRRNRSRSCGWATTRSGGSSLMATTRSRWTSRAMYTMPMPPRPSSRSIEYLPASACWKVTKSRSSAALPWDMQQDCTCARRRPACVTLGLRGALPFGARLGDALRASRSGAGVVVPVRTVGVPHPRLRGAPDLLHRALRHDRRHVSLDERVPRLHMLVAVLDEEPRWLAGRSTPAARPHEHPAPLHAGTVKDHLEIALPVTLADAVFAAALFGFVPAAIPEHHRAAAVFALWNGALECVVLDRMILDLHRQTLDRRIGTWPLGHRPALHHAVELQPQVEVQMTRRVLLDDEVQLLRLRGLVRSSFGFGGLLEIALAAVLGELLARGRRVRFARGLRCTTRGGLLLRGHETLVTG